MGMSGSACHEDADTRGNATTQRNDLNGADVPIVDADAYATFYLSALANASQRVQDIFGWANGHGSAS